MGRRQLTIVPTETELSDALDTLEEFVEKIGDNIVESNTEVLNTRIGDEKIILTGHVCRTDNHFYYVGGHEKLSGATVAFHYSIINNIATEIPKEHAIEVLNSAGIESQETDPRREAAQYLFGSIDVSQTRNLIDHLRIEKSEADTHLTFTEMEGHPTGFSVQRMIFPYQDDFDLKEFYQAALAVVETGKKLSVVLRTHISLQINETDPRNTRIIIE